MARFKLSRPRKSSDSVRLDLVRNPGARKYGLRCAPTTCSTGEEHGNTIPGTHPFVLLVLPVRLRPGQLGGPMNVFQGTPNKLKHLWPRLAEQLLHQGRSIGQQGATGSQRREAIADPLLDDGAAHRNIRCGEPVARLVAGGILPK